MQKEQIGVLSQHVSCVYMGQVTEVNAEVNSEVGAQLVRPASPELRFGGLGSKP